jgi:hypothetical protein
MNKSQIIALYDQDQRINIEYPDTQREVTPNVVRHINLSGTGDGAIIYCQLTEANAEVVIRQQVAYFGIIGQDFEWKVLDYDRPSDLRERLGFNGFEVEEAEAIMVLDLSDAPEILWQPVRHNVQRIIHPEKISDVITVEQQVWDEDYAQLGRYLRQTLSTHAEQMSVYVAYVDEQPVSTAWTYFSKQSQFASLWGGSTISSFRRQGLYTALLAVRAQEARSRQLDYLTVDASAMSRPILEKFGFETIAYSYPCKWKLKR